MIDTHVHYSHKKFDCGRDSILQELHDDCSGQCVLSAALEVAIDLESNQRMPLLLGKYPWISFSAGYHPSRVDFCEKRDEEAIKVLRNAIEGERVIAVGETGLDYHLMGDLVRKYPGYEIGQIVSRQELWFRRQIELAYEYELPLVLHIRDASEEDIQVIRERLCHRTFPNATERALQILGEYEYREKCGVVHCFYGSYETALRYLECGDFVFGIGGSVTYDIPEFAEAVKRLHESRLVLETDTPFVRPAGAPGGRNHSGNLSFVTAQISALRGISEEEVIRICDVNAKRVFAFEQP